MYVHIFEKTILLSVFQFRRDRRIIIEQNNDQELIQEWIKMKEKG